MLLSLKAVRWDFLVENRLGAGAVRIWSCWSFHPFVIIIYSYFNKRCRIKSSNLQVKTEWCHGYLLQFAYHHWGNLQVCIFARGIFVFLSVKPFLYLFFRRYVVWIILFKWNEAKKDLFYTCLKRKETKNVSFAIRCISLVFSTRGTLFLRPYYLSVLSLSFELQSDNVNWNSCM